MEVKSGRMFEKEILPFMEEEIMRKLRTYNVYSIKEYEDIRKAVRYSIRFCKTHKIVRCEDKNLNKIMDYCGIDTRFRYCESNNRSNPMRKPNTGMLEKLFDNYKSWNAGLSEKDCLMIGDASGLEGQFSDSDKKTAENFGIDYMDVSEFVKVYGKGI